MNLWHRSTFDLVIVLFHLKPVKSWNVTFIICMSYTTLPYSYDYLGPAIDLAMSEVTKKYDNITFSLVNLSPADVHSCVDLDARIVEFVSRYVYVNEIGRENYQDQTNLVVTVTDACSDALKNVGDLARELDMPVLCSGGTDQALSNRKRFPSLLRLQPYRTKDIVETVLQFCEIHGWDDIYLLCDTNPNLGNFFGVACTAMETAVKNNPGSRVYRVDFDSMLYKDESYQSLLGNAATYSRIMIIVAHGNTTRRMMLNAHALGHTKGDFVYLTMISMEHPLHGYFRWQYYDGHDEAAKEAFQSLYFVSTKPTRGPDYTSFEVEMKYLAYKKYNYTYEPEERVSAFAAFQHTVILLFAELVNESAVVNQTISSGSDITSGAFVRRNVSSVAGDFTLVDGDRSVYQYVVMAMEPNSSIFHAVYTYDTTNNSLLPVPGTVVYWAHRSGPPPNTPPCGFSGNENDCDEYGNSVMARNIATYLGTALGLLAIGISSYFFIRRCRHSVDHDFRWYVPLADLQLHNASIVSSANARNKSQTSLAGSSAKAGLNKRVVKPENLATYRETTVWIRKMQLSHRFSPNGHQELLIKKMKEIHHINIARFYGFCPVDVTMNVLSEYSSRGSLSDVMHSATIRFDTALKHSVTSDLTNGLLFLHDSALGHHGDLTTHRCLVDSRFVLKIAYYRMDILPEAIPNLVGENENYRRFVTFSPEQLRGPTPHIFQGSKEADVYAYGYLVAEVLCDTGPFEKELENGDLNPKEILTRITRTSGTPYRPTLPADCPTLLQLLIERCWDDRPSSRPTMRSIEHYVKTMPGFERNVNFVDSLFKRMEDYAYELESRISAMTAHMMEEKRKSEDLLFQVLPKHLASALTQGKEIKPEGFDEVTIAFTALADFVAISFESTPLEVVKLLNDLYSMFDSTMDRYDVYKVETIGDSYMISSGVPARNGFEHSRQVARISLDLIRQAKSFVIPHRPDAVLQMKIGFHTGGIAAGIVGLKMPRYCLFGDTVNTASRMTSFGMAFKIHCSTSAKVHLEKYFEFKFQYRGQIEIKGKGMQNTYWLHSELKKELPETKT